jgi:hypothetical protein
MCVQNGGLWMNETVKKVGRWLGCMAAGMAFYAWELLRETASTPLGQLTLGQLGATLFWVLAALVVAAGAWGVWENRDHDQSIR